MRSFSAAVGVATTTLVAVALVATPAAQATDVPAGGGVGAATYQTIDLGGLGGNYTWATGMNDRGQVVGFSQATDGSIYPFRWQDGRMTRLATFDAGGDDPYHGAAAGINNRGDVVGAARAASGGVRAVMWRDGHLIDLGLPGTGGYAVAVNDRGDVVGAYAGADGGEHAYLWRHATVTRLGTGPRLTVRDINDRGIVAGSMLDRPEAPTAVVWRRGTFVNLAGPDAEATSVNERGQVVGWSNVTPGNQLRAVRWERNSTTNLGVLPGGTGSAAVSINNRGQILGWSEDRRPRRTAFLWENGVLIDLASRGVPVDSVPIALNDHGDILANVFTGDGYGRAALFRLP